MKTFEHDFLNAVPLKRTTIGGRRVYETPTGEKYPSVTTIINAVADKSGILEWRARVGEEQADKIVRESQVKGTLLHDMMETYLRNIKLDYTAHHPITGVTFKTLTPLLDKRVGKIYGIEIPLYSHRLKVAGSADLICDFDGIPSVVDLKGSIKVKRKEYVHTYFMQATLYALLAYELFGLKIKQIVIIVVPDDEPIPQVFIENVSDHMEEAIKMVRTFYDTK